VHEQKPTVFDHDHAEPAPPVRSFVVFLVLAGLTCLAILLGFVDLGPVRVWLSLGVAVTQTIVLTLFFMDLRDADKLTWLTAIAGVFWTFLLFLFIITDQLTRHLYAY
jgi:caa(3)-type oxidase subunit IV